MLLFSKLEIVLTWQPEAVRILDHTEKAFQVLRGGTFEIATCFPGCVNAVDVVYNLFRKRLKVNWNMSRVCPTDSQNNSNKSKLEKHFLSDVMCANENTCTTENCIKVMKFVQQLRNFNIP